MDFRYFGDPSPVDYVDLDGQSVLDPTRDYILSETGKRDLFRDPEIVAFRVVMTFRATKQTMVTHPLRETDAVDYESRISKALPPGTAETELRPVFGWRKGREKVGPLSGEKWLWHQAATKPAAVYPPDVMEVIRLGLRFIELSNAEEPDPAAIVSYYQAMQQAMQEVACSDQPHLNKWMRVVGIDYQGCTFAAHDPILH